MSPAPFSFDTHGKAVMAAHPCLLLIAGEEKEPLTLLAWGGGERREHRAACSLKSPHPKYTEGGSHEDGSVGKLNLAGH